MRQFFFFRSSLFVAMLVGFCAPFAHSAPPQIIEVNRDPSISREERMLGFELSIKPFTPRYKTDCNADTTYWVISKNIYPAEGIAFQHIPDQLKIIPASEKVYNNRGTGLIGKSDLPPEIQPYFSNHFILTTNSIENCTQKDVAKLSQYFGAAYVESGVPDPTYNCVLVDSFEVIDSVASISKTRATTRGEAIHKVIPNLFHGPLEFSNSGISLILGSCKDKYFVSKVAPKLDTNFLIFRVLSK